MLWATSDSGTTWHDTMGRTFERHTNFVLRKDGSILGMGGKNSAIDNFMPRAISHDGGRTYARSKTPFSQGNSGQRPSILRLASGRLFMAGDYHPSKRAEKPASIKEDGSYVALSDDETWRNKRIPGTFSVHRGKPSLGYSVAKQAPNGVIHLITSCNHRGRHFELNDAWILNDATLADDEIKQREADHALGVKTGVEIVWETDGAEQWERQHRNDGTIEWTTWWPDGSLRSQSTWKNHALVAGTDKLFDPAPVVLH